MKVRYKQCSLDLQMLQYYGCVASHYVNIYYVCPACDSNISYSISDSKWSHSTPDVLRLVSIQIISICLCVSKYVFCFFTLSFPSMLVFLMYFY